jgi:hypothetical protein
MRISKGRGWLAVVALALGTAQGDLVNFSTTDFAENYGDQSAAVLLLKNFVNREFRWTASNVIVEDVKLWAIRSSTGEPDLVVGYGEKIEGGTAISDSPEANIDTTSSASPSRHTPSSDHLGSGNAPFPPIGGRNPQITDLPTDPLVMDRLSGMYRLLPVI